MAQKSDLSSQTAEKRRLKTAFIPILLAAQIIKSINLF